MMFRYKKTSHHFYVLPLVGGFYVLPWVGGSPHFVDSSASKLLSTCIVHNALQWICCLALFSVFLAHLLGEPPFALGGFEPVDAYLNYSFTYLVSPFLLWEGSNR